MDKRKAVLSLLTLVVLASGCSHGGDGPQGSVTVKELSVTPTQIYSGQNVRAWLEVQNTGSLPAEVGVGEKGEKILKNYCRDDIFSYSKEDFSASSSRATAEQENYDLKPGDVLRTSWELEQEGRVPIYGYKCDLRFEVPFNYSVSAYKQIQIKKNRKVEGSENLQYKSSSGPLRLSIDTLQGPTGKPDTYLAAGSEQGKDEVTVRIQLVNGNPSEEYRKGVVDIDESSLRVKSTSPLNLNEKMDSSGSWSKVESSAENSNEQQFKCDIHNSEAGCENLNGCNWNGNTCVRDVEEDDDTFCEDIEGDITLAEGKSKIIRCKVPLPESIDSPGVISEISGQVNYTYIKDAGSRNIEVKRRE